MQRWKWRGYYNDGTFVEQNTVNPDTGRNWSSDHLDRSRLMAIVLEPLSESVPRMIYEIREGETPKRFWRQYHILGSDGSTTTWSMKLTTGNVSFFNFLRPDGSIVLTTNPEGSELKIDNELVNAFRMGDPYSDLVLIVDKNGSSHNSDMNSISLSSGEKTVYQFFKSNGEILMTTDPNGSFVV